MEVNGNFEANGTISAPNLIVGGISTPGALQLYGANSTSNVIQLSQTGGSNPIEFQVDGEGDVTAQGNQITAGYVTTSTWLGLHQTSSAPGTSPGSSYGALAYKGGSQYWYYNATTPGWASVDLAASGSGYWTLSGSLIYPASTSYNLLVGETTEVSGAKMEVNGNFEANGTIQSYVSGGTTQIAFQTATGSSNAFSVNYNGYISAVNEHLTGTAFFGQTGTPSDDGTASYLQVQAPNGAVFSGTVSDTFFTGVSGNTGPNALVTHTGGTLPAGEYVVELYVTANGLSGSIATVVNWYDVRNYVSYTATLLSTGGQGWSFPIRVDGIHNPNISTTLTGTVTAYDYSVALVKVM